MSVLESLAIEVTGGISVFYNSVENYYSRNSYLIGVARFQFIGCDGNRNKLRTNFFEAS